MPWFRRNKDTQPKAHKKRRREERRRRGVTAIEKFVVEEIEVGGIPTRPTPAPITAPKPAAAWAEDARLAAAWIGLWTLLVAAALFARSGWPVDETRVLAIAWDMRLAGDFLLPSLNNELSYQPPLLYSLVYFGWKFFGAEEWWARMLPALFSLAALYMTGRLARLLWPRSPDAARYAPFMLLGIFFWALYTTVTLGDMLLVFFTLLALRGVLIMWRRRDMRAWMLLGAALGLGVLAHGFAILLYVLPVALLAPLWAAGSPGMNWKYWYLDTTKALLLAIAVVAAWAVPAARDAGVPYIVKWITVSLSPPVLELFPGSRPWWWYALLLPLLLLPWSLWPLLWMRLWRIRRQKLNPGILFCMAWVFPTLALLSLYDVKQPQMLLPLLPAGVLAGCYLLFDGEIPPGDEDRPLAGMSIPLILLGGLFAVMPKLPRVEFLPGFLWELSPLIGVGVIVVGIVLAWLPFKESRQRVLETAAFSASLVAIVVLVVGSQFEPLREVKDVARALAQAQQARRPIAHVGDYQGQFHFYGRLEHPLSVLAADEAEAWAERYPSGVLVVYAGAWQPRLRPGARPMLEAPYLDGAVYAWEAAALAGRRR